jgi:hypothetical protein
MYVRSLMQHIATLAPLVVEESHLNWLAAQLNTCKMCKQQNPDQAVENSNKVKAATS